MEERRSRFCVVVIGTSFLLMLPMLYTPPFLQGAEVGRVRTLCPSGSRFTVPEYGLRGPIEWSALPEYVQADFTLNSRIAVKSAYYMEGGNSGPKSFSRSQIEDMITKANAKEFNFGVYGKEKLSLYAALDAHPVKGKRALVVGTIIPWVEAILLSYGVHHVTTVDFNKIMLDHPSMSSMNISELDQYDGQFDALVSFSSLEHDGLGRYSDPLNPFGDIARMKKMRGLLAASGLLYLAIPSGNDTLYWNAHRVYGSIRWPLLLDGWEILDIFHLRYQGNDLLEMLERIPSGTQPVLVLKQV